MEGLVQTVQDSLRKARCTQSLAYFNGEYCEERDTLFHMSDSLSDA